MKLLKNRKFAVLIAIIVMVLATLIGVRGSLIRLVRDVEAMFYDGVYLEEGGYKQPGINSHLENRARAALDLATVMKNNPGLNAEVEVLLSVRQELISAESITEKLAANKRLQTAFSALADKAQRNELSEREIDALNHHTPTFNGAQTAIENSQYSQKAAAYMDDASFIAKILRPFLFVKPPQT